MSLFRINLDSTRVYGLDIMRAAAILLVLVQHGRFLLPKELDFFFLDGVTIFFVLSGFLIGGILIKEFNREPRDGELLNFWARRWFRTLPNYFMVLSVLMCIDFVWSENFHPWWYKKYFLFAQNLFERHPNWFPEAWSLSVEEWFYLLIPIGISFGVRRLGFTPLAVVASLAFSIVVLSTGLRAWRYHSGAVESALDFELEILKPVFNRLDSIMYGVIGALIHYYRREAWSENRRLMLGTGMALLLVSEVARLTGMYSMSGLYSCVFSFSVMSLGSLMLLPYLSGLKTGQGVVYRGLTYVSVISYSLYLLHLSLVQFRIVERIPWQSLLDNTPLIYILKYGAYWILSIALSILTYKYFEEPMMRLRDHSLVKRLIAHGGSSR